MTSTRNGLLALGGLTLGIGYLALRNRGSRTTPFRGGRVAVSEVLVLYQADGTGAPEFRSRGEAVAALYGAQAKGVTSGDQIIQYINQARGLRRIIWLGHGSTRAYFRPGYSGVRVGVSQPPLVRSVAEVARVLAPKLRSGWILGLAGCASGASLDEDVWGPAVWGPGGQTGFAAQMRDAIARAGAPYGVVRAHTTIGHTTRNPAGREFFEGRANISTAGASVAEQYVGIRPPAAKMAAWKTQFQGVPAERWISGLTGAGR